jgi:hypothetical protein
MDKKIKDLINNSTTGSQLRDNSNNKKYGGGKSKVILYKDLFKYGNLTNLFKDFDIIFILYEWANKIGHWVVLIKTGNYIEFYDSYSYEADNQFKFIPAHFHYKPILTKMLANSNPKFSLNYNNYKFQKSGNVATCGRHCLVRAWFKDMNIDDYKGMLDYIKKNTGYDYDEIVTIMTQNI